MDIEDFSANRGPRLRALIPFGVFLVFYMGLSIVSGDFYRVPMTVAFLVASASALVLNHKASLKSKIDLFAHGMGDINIMTMCLIFVLAGAFAETARRMGAVDSTIQIALSFIPPHLMLCGLFMVACFISLAIGTSVGTIVALTPIALGVTQTLGISGGLCLGAVVGGAMFGDNLSMISDTTIAATRTQGIEMREKFTANLHVAAPAAIVTVILYIILSHTGEPMAGRHLTLKMFLDVIPYLCILVLALTGLNVMALLMLGTLLAGVIGIINGSFSFWEFLAAAGVGARSMADTLIVAILAGGLLKVIRYNGGIEYLMKKIERLIRGRRSCEFGIALLVGVVNVFTANNTVAIVIAGPIAKDLAKRYEVSPARSASILDTTSCIVQGMIPYGAQILSAVGLAGAAAVSASEVMKFLCYPYVLALFLTGSILLAGRRKSADAIQP
ncbi:MAG TPA: sodium:proton antiporter [Lentisphaeria bacterium]|nr:sodium:proton antiporter [Lentisphaeria bacterium]HCG50029.1 sodium:proton antiporter [Lentisphaeria bacterium]